MKIILTSLSLLLAGAALHPQSSINFGLTYGQRLNYREYSPSNSTSGLSVEYATGLSSGLDLRLLAGIEGTQPRLFDQNQNYLAYDNFMVVPVKVGLQRFIAGETTFLMAEAGPNIGFFPYDWTGDAKPRIGFSYALGGGYRFHFNQRKYLQAGLSFNHNPYGNIYPFSSIALRVAYGLKWGNKK